MKKHFWIQILEKNGVGLAGKNLDLRFHVPKGLTKKQIEELDGEISRAIEAYDEEHGDCSNMDYHEILENAAKKRGIEFEYPKAEYTLYI